MLNSIISFRLFHYALNADIKKFYYQISTDDFFRKLNLSIWFDDLKNLQGPYILQQNVGGFGFNFATAATELGFEKFIIPACKNEITKILLRYGKYVDDLAYSFATKALYDECVADLQEVLQKYNLQLKFLINQYSDTSDEFHKVLDYQWHLKSDLLHANVFPTFFSKKKGKKIHKIFLKNLLRYVNLLVNL